METQIVEHKKSFGKEVIISLVALANTEGGSVVVGVDDDGNPCGLEVGPETVQRCLNDIKAATYPQLVPKTRIVPSASAVSSRKPLLLMIMSSGAHCCRPSRRR